MGAQPHRLTTNLGYSKEVVSLSSSPSWPKVEKNWVPKSILLDGTEFPDNQGHSGRDYGDCGLLESPEQSSLSDCVRPPQNR